MNDPIIVERRDRIVSHTLNRSPRNILDMELIQTHDMRAGLTACLEKRPPTWRHR